MEFLFFSVVFLITLVYFAAPSPLPPLCISSGPYSRSCLGNTVASVVGAQGKTSNAPGKTSIPRGKVCFCVPNACTSIETVAKSTNCEPKECYVVIMNTNLAV